MAKKALMTRTKVNKAMADSNHENKNSQGGSSEEAESAESPISQPSASPYHMRRRSCIKTGDKNQTLNSKKQSRAAPTSAASPESNNESDDDDPVDAPSRNSSTKSFQPVVEMERMKDESKLLLLKDKLPDEVESGKVKQETEKEETSSEVKEATKTDLKEREDVDEDAEELERSNSSQNGQVKDTRKPVTKATEMTSGKIIPGKNLLQKPPFHPNKIVAVQRIVPVGFNQALGPAAVIMDPATPGNPKMPALNIPNMVKVGGSGSQHLLATTPEGKKPRPDVNLLSQLPMFDDDIPPMKKKRGRPRKSDIAMRKLLETEDDFFDVMRVSLTKTMLDYLNASHITLEVLARESGTKIINENNVTMLEGNWNHVAMARLILKERVLAKVEETKSEAEKKNKVKTKRKMKSEKDDSSTGTKDKDGEEDSSGEESSVQNLEEERDEAAKPTKKQGKRSWRKMKCNYFPVKIRRVLDFVEGKLPTKTISHEQAKPNITDEEEDINDVIDSVLAECENSDPSKQRVQQMNSEVPIVIDIRPRSGKGSGQGSSRLYTNLNTVSQGEPKTEAKEEEEVSVIVKDILSSVLSNATGSTDGDVSKSKKPKGQTEADCLPEMAHLNPAQRDYVIGAIVRKVEVNDRGVTWNVKELVCRNKSKGRKSEVVQCNICDFEISRSNLNSHKRRIHSELAYVCNICFKIFHHIIGVKMHLKSHFAGSGKVVKMDGFKKKERYTCMHCNRTFTRLHDRFRHVEAHGFGDTQEDLNAWDELHKYSQGQSDEDDMELGDEGMDDDSDDEDEEGSTPSSRVRLKCNICYTEFKRACELNNHMKTHTENDIPVLITTPINGENEIGPSKLMKVFSDCFDFIADRSSSKRYSCILCMYSCKGKKAGLEHIHEEHPYLVKEMEEEEEYQREVVNIAVESDQKLQQQQSEDLEEGEVPKDNDVKTSQPSLTAANIAAAAVAAVAEPPKRAFDSNMELRKEDFIFHPKVEQKMEDQVSNASDDTISQDEEDLPEDELDREQEELNESMKREPSFELRNIAKVVNDPRKTLMYRDPEKATYACKKCTFRSSRSGLHHHMRRYHPSIIYSCDICEKKFGLFFELRNHRRSHFDKDGNRKPAQWRQGYKYGKEGQPPPFTCKVCKRGFYRQVDLKHHMRTHDDIGGTIKIEQDGFLHCMECSYTTTHLRAMRAHQARQHNILPASSLRCCICGKGFSRKAFLKLHMESVHLEDGKCSCPECGKDFNHLRYLHAHMKRHTVDREFQCVTCNKSFKDRQTLARHMETHNSEENKQSYQCNECGHQFARLIQLRDHENTHSGRRPYVCKLCGKTFTHSSVLSNHLKFHSQVKQYKCPVVGCGKAFVVKSKLGYHLAAHTGTKKYKCHDCGRTYTQNSILRRHRCAGKSENGGADRSDELIGGDEMGAGEMFYNEKGQLMMTTADGQVVDAMQSAEALAYETAAAGMGSMMMSGNYGAEAGMSDLNSLDMANQAGYMVTAADGTTWMVQNTPDGQQQFVRFDPNTGQILMDASELDLGGAIDENDINPLNPGAQLNQDMLQHMAAVGLTGTMPQEGGTEPKMNDMIGQVEDPQLGGPGGFSQGLMENLNQANSLINMPYPGAADSGQTSSANQMGDSLQAALQSDAAISQLDNQKPQTLNPTALSTPTASCYNPQDTSHQAQLDLNSPFSGHASILSHSDPMYSSTTPGSSMMPTMDMSFAVNTSVNSSMAGSMSDLSRTHHVMSHAINPDAISRGHLSNPHHHSLSEIERAAMMALDTAEDVDESVNDADDSGAGNETTEAEERMYKEATNVYNAQMQQELFGQQQQQEQHDHNQMMVNAGLGGHSASDMGGDLGEDTNNVYMCALCNQIYPSWAEVETHMHEHTMEMAEASAKIKKKQKMALGDASQKMALGDTSHIITSDTVKRENSSVDLGIDPAGKDAPFLTPLASASGISQSNHPFPDFPTSKFE